MNAFRVLHFATAAQNQKKYKLVDLPSGRDGEWNQNVRCAILA